jgi:hypothetical protein
MNSRDDAIQYLKNLGYAARARDWILGSTIVVPIGKKRLSGLASEDGTEIYVWDEGLWLYPSKAEGWTINDSRDVWNSDKKYPSLPDAVFAAETIARELNTDLE